MAEIDFTEEPAIDFLSDEDALQAGAKTTERALGEVTRSLTAGALAAPEPRPRAPIVPPTLAGVTPLPVAPPELAQQIISAPFRAAGSALAAGVRTARDVLSPTTYLPEEEQARLRPFVIDTRGGEIRPMTRTETAEREPIQGGRPLFTAPRTQLQPEGTDVTRIMEQWSSPEGIFMLAAGNASRLIGYSILASMVPGLVQDAQAIASSATTPEEKRDKINNLFLLSGMVAGHGAGLGRPVSELTKEELAVPPPLPMTGAEMVGRPRGFVPTVPTAGPERLGPPIPPARVRTMAEAQANVPGGGAVVTAPETGRELNQLEEIRQKGLQTREQVLENFPQLRQMPNPRERAAELLRQAYPRPIQGPPIPPGGVPRQVPVRTVPPMGPVPEVAGTRPVVEPMRVRNEPVFQGPEIPPEVQAQREREANMQREVEARRSALQQNIVFWERELEMARNRGDRRAQEEAAGQLMLFRREYEAIPPVKQITPKPPIARAPGSAFRPEVPGTPAEPREPVLAEIRRRKLRTKEAVLDAFPAMREQPQAREKAAELIRQAWERQGPPLPPEEPPAAPPGAPVPVTPPAPPPGAPSAAVQSQVEQGEAVLRQLEKPTAAEAIEGSVQPGGLPAKGTEAPPLSESARARLQGRVRRAKEEGVLGPPPPEAPPAAPATPATIEETVIAGKTLAEWEAVRSPADLPRGTARAELARWLAVPNQPGRILQALGNKKRTREIHAPPAAEVTPVAPAAPEVAPAPAPEAAPTQGPPMAPVGSAENSYTKMLSTPRQEGDFDPVNGERAKKVDERTATLSDGTKLRITPPGQPKVPDLLKKGMTVTDKYGTYKVWQVKGPFKYYGLEAYTVQFEDARKPGKAGGWHNELVAQDGKIYQLFEGGGEVFTKIEPPPGEEPPAAAPTPPAPEPPAPPAPGAHPVAALFPELGITGRPVVSEDGKRLTTPWITRQQHMDLEVAADKIGYVGQGIEAEKGNKVKVNYGPAATPAERAIKEKQSRIGRMEVIAETNPESADAARAEIEKLNREIAELQGQAPPAAAPVAPEPPAPEAPEPPAPEAPKLTPKAQLDAMLDPNAIMRGKKPEGKMVKGRYETPPMSSDALEAFARKAQDAGWKYHGYTFFGASGIKWKTGSFSPPEPGGALPETAPAERAAAQQIDVALQRQLKGAEPTASTETPGEQKAGFDTKQAKQQKTFLLGEVDKAIDEAPKQAIGAWQSLELETENNLAQNAIDASVEGRAAAFEKIEPLFQKYQIPTEEPASEPYPDIEGKMQQAEKGGPLKPTQRAALLQRAIQKANFEASPKVTIEVPGDGTFEIVNSKAALEDFREKAASFPTTAPRPKVESKTARATPTAAPAVGKLDKDSALRAAKLFGSSDPGRLILNYAHSDGKTTVATDGRRLIEINTPLGGSAKKPAFTKLNDKAPALEKDAKFPNYNQVIPTDADLTQVFNGLDAARLFNIVEQAKQVVSEKATAATIWRNPDGSLGMTAGAPEIGSYSHNIKPGAKSVVALNADYLSDIFSAARILGDEKVNFFTRFEQDKHAELNPIVVKGKNFKAVLMPMRMNGESANAIRASDIKGKPSMGPGAAAAAEFDPPPPSANVVGLDAGNRFVNEKVREWENMVAGFRQLGLFREGGRASEKRDIQRAVDSMINIPRVWSQQAGNSFRLRLRNVAEQNAVTALMQALKMSGEGLKMEDAERLGALEHAGDPMGYLRANQTDLETFAQQMLNEGKKLEAGGAIDLAKAMAYAREHYAELKPIAIEAKKRLDAQFARDAAAGLPVDYERWYVPQRHSIDLLPAANRPIVLGGGRGAGVGSPFRKAKVYEDYSSAIQAGFTPRSLSIADLLEHRVLESERVIARKAMFEGLKEVKDPGDGNPIAMKIPRRTITRPDGSFDIQESVPLNYEAFEIMPGVRLAIHRGYSRMLRALTGTSQISESAVVGAAQSVAAIEKHIGLALDTFHLSRVLQTELALTGKVSLGPRLHRGVALVEYTSGDLNRAVQEGFITQEMADWARKPVPYEVNGRTVNLSPKGLVAIGLKNGLNIGRIADVIYRDWIRDIPLLGKVNKLVFDKISRSAMIHGFMAEFGRVAKNHPEWDANKVAATVASDINVLFGNLQKESWVQSPSLNAIARIVMLAPQWVESLIRREGRAAVQLGQAGFRLAQGKAPDLGTAGKTMGTGLLAYFMGTQVLNLITRGHLTFQNEEPEHKLDAYVPDPFSTGKGFFISPMAVFGEITHDILRYAQTKPDIATALSQIGANKLGNLGRAIGVAMLGRDPLSGEKIIGTGRRAMAAAAQAIPVPIIASGAARMVAAPFVPGVQRPTGSDIERQAASSFGFKIEPAPSAQGEVRRLVDQWKSTQEPKLQADVERRMKEEFRSSYSDLRSALGRGDIMQAKRAYQQLRQEGSTPQQIRKTIEHPHPFAGSKVLENRFYDSLTPQQQKLYEEALKEREDISDRLEKMLDTTPQLEE